MIPKTVHYCWFGSKEMPLLNRACMASWTEELPGYEIVRWDESNAPMDHPFVAYHYAKKHWAYVSDFVRLYALHTHGGVYLDTDVEVVRALDPLLHHRLFFGYESEGRINSAVCGSQAGEAFLDACMGYMLQRHERRLPYRIAPEVITDVFEANPYPEVAVLPPKSFYPYNPYVPGSPGQLLFHDVTEATYAIHHWAKSWKMGWAQRILRKLI